MGEPAREENSKPSEDRIKTARESHSSFSSFNHLSLPPLLSSWHVHEHEQENENEKQTSRLQDKIYFIPVQCVVDGNCWCFCTMTPRQIPE